MEKKDLRINGSRLKSGDFVRTLWVATVEQGVTKEDIMEPSFWAHVAVQFSPYDRIEVRVDDGLYFSELLILSCDRTWAKVFELSHHSLASEETIPHGGEMSEFEVKWKGPINKFCVLRKSDSAIIQKEFVDRVAATAFLNNYEKTIAA